MEPSASPRPESRLASQLKRMRSLGIAFVIGLLMGLVPLGLNFYQVSRQRDDSRRQLRELSPEVALGQAAVLSRRGEYPRALAAASRFFSDAREELSAQPTTTSARHDFFRSALTERDAVIALLARNDPASAERLAEMYVSYRAAVESPLAAPQQ